MFDYSQITFVIGMCDKNNYNKVQMLGTGFLISNEGLVVTARHVVGNECSNLRVLLPHVPNVNCYQDVQDTSCRMSLARIEAVNPITDLCVLKINQVSRCVLPDLKSLDDIRVGEKIGIFGFPHCTMGRRVLTYQEAEIGAKMLLETRSVKSKYATINIQTRPGQSGSLVFNLRTGVIVGLLIGTYAPPSGINLAGINPYELNQTSYCISASHIREML